MAKYKVTGTLAGSAKSFTVEAVDDVAAFNLVVSKHPEFEMQQVNLAKEDPPPQVLDDQKSIEEEIAKRNADRFQEYVATKLQSADKFVTTCDTFIGFIRAMCWLAGGFAILLSIVASVSNGDASAFIVVPLIACFTYGAAEFQVMFLRFMREVVSQLALRNRM